MPKKYRQASSNISTREESLFSARETAQPLAARMRPRTLEEFVGQEHLLASGKALRSAIESGAIKSMVFWGPPGSGKTLRALCFSSVDAITRPDQRPEDQFQRSRSC
jgi:replication-associated recombination protein RarA